MDTPSKWEGMTKKEVDENYIKTLGKFIVFLIKTVWKRTYHRNNWRNYK